MKTKVIEDKQHIPFILLWACSTCQSTHETQYDSGDRLSLSANGITDIKDIRGDWITVICGICKAAQDRAVPYVG